VIPALATIAQIWNASGVGEGPDDGHEQGDADHGPICRKSELMAMPVAKMPRNRPPRVAKRGTDSPMPTPGANDRGKNAVQ
jgi:hypothetical protein